MSCNKEFINTFEEKEYQRILKDKQLLANLKDIFINKYSTDNDNIKIDVVDLLFKESLDHYVYRELTNNPDFINSNEMWNYVKYIIDIYNVSSMELNTNVVLRDNKLRQQIIDKYLPKYKEILEEKSKKDNDKCDKIIQKIEKNISVTQSEFDYACEYLAKLRFPQLKEYEILLKYIFGEMKNTNLKLSYQAQDFILTYVPYFYDDGYAKDVRVVLGTSDRKREIKGPAHSAGSSSYVAINKKAFSDVNLKSIDDSNVERLKIGSDITFFMIVNFHEITHQIQRKKSKSSIYDDQGMAHIIRGILNRELKDYKANHDSDGIEIDANMHGWKNADAFFNKFYSGVDKERLHHNCYVNSNTSSIRRVFAYKKDKDGKYFPYDEYDISNLVAILKNNPSYLDKYPMLKIFFSDKGRPKISYVTKRDFYTDQTGMEFVRYFVRTNGIERMMTELDKRKFNDSEVNHLLNNIYYYIKQSLQKVEKLNYVIYHKNAGEYRNNEEFNEEVANKLALLHSRNALNAYQKAFPLFEKIRYLYPQCSNYVTQIVDQLNSKFGFDSSTYDNDDVKKRQ